MRALVAGGAGFLGSYLTEKLVGMGYEVTVIDDLSSGREENLKSVAGKIKFIKGDIVELPALDDRFDLIFNLASRASRAEWENYPVEVMLPNSVGNANLIKLALKDGAKYLYTSTSEAYGNPDVVPTPESYFTAMNHLGSRAPYDESKKFGETLIKGYEKEYGLKSVIVRLFNTYGPRMRGGNLYGRVIDRFIQQALANEPVTVYGGSQTRSFTYVDDTIDGMWTVMEKGEVGEIYNIGSSEEVRILDLANMIIELTGSSSKVEMREMPPEDPARRAADTTKVSKLGWSKKISMRDGISKMIKSY